jgi:uncharacterized protein YjdB
MKKSFYSIGFMLLLLMAFDSTAQKTLKVTAPVVTATKQLTPESSVPNYWREVPAAQQPAKQLMRIHPEKYLVYRFDDATLKAQMFALSTDPAKGMVISLPMSDGSFRKFRVWQTPMFPDDLAARYPGIKTFTAEATNDARVTAKIDFTLFGFHAMVFEQGNTSFIDPYDNLNDGYYIAYSKKDVIRPMSQRMRCEVGDPGNINGLVPMPTMQTGLPPLDTKKMSVSKEGGKVGAKATNGWQLRTYRMALSANHYYCQAATGLPTPTIAQCLSAMTTSMNRVNGVYNREFSVQMNFVANEDTLIWPTTTGSINGTDPFDAINSNPGSCISMNQTVCDARIGTSGPTGQYDIGHVFTTGAGGLASLGIVCNASNKARGVTGSSSPVGDPYDIDYVAHEVGHQFGSNHTFNNNSNGSCAGNASSANAYEPGSGATIMDYAGICAPDNLQPNSDPYFNGSSLEQIYTRLIGSEDVCAAKTATGNKLPYVAPFTATYNIPYKTPFELIGPTAIDSAGDTAITYGWFQWNRGDFGNTLANTFVNGPIFRSYQPVYTPTRVFPKIDSVLKGVLTFVSVNNKMGEKAPDTARYLTFRMAVRGILAGNGALNLLDDTIHLNVSTTGSGNGYAGFRVTSQNTTGITYTGGSTQTVTWNVVGTNAAPVNAANVVIYMSTDGGYTWPYTIGTFPNTGTASVTIPNPPSSSTTARIKVKGSGNVFFNVNSTNFTVNPGASTAPITGTFTVCPGGTTTLSDATAGGTWNSTNTSVATIGSSSGIVTGVAPGTTLISYNAASGTVTAIVTVNALPTAGTITGSSAVCIGQTTSLSNAVTGGAWSSSNITIATVNSSGVVSGVSAGTVNITYSVTNSCGTATTTKAMTVSAPTAVAPITGTMSACVGANTTLSDVTPSGTWSSSNTAVATVSAAGVVNGVAAGTAIISYGVTNPSGCVSSATATVTINTLPSATISPTGTVNICTGATLTMSATTGTGLTYQWQVGATNITGATNSTYATSTSGDYRVVITNSNGCVGTSPATTVNVTTGLSVTPSVAFGASPGTSFCNTASPVTFTASSVNGGSAPIYRWYVNGVLSGTGTTYMYTPADADVVKVVLTSNAPCAFPDTAAYSTTMTVSPLVFPAVTVSASPNDTVCTGTIVTFTAPSLYSGTAPIYTWIKNGVNVATGTTYNYAPPVGDDTIIVSMLSNYWCLAATTAVSTPFIIRAETPVSNTVSVTASATSIAAGQVVTFAATAPYGGAYQWFINGIAVPGATSSVYITDSLKNGEVVNCAVTGNRVCALPNTVISAGIVMQVTLSLDELKAGNLKIMPNPNSGSFAINGMVYSADENISIIITNTLGQTVYNGIAMIRNNRVNEHINLESALASGMYFIKLSTTNDHVVLPVVISK